MTTTFWSKIPAFSPLIALVKHHHHHHHPRSNTYAQYQCLGRSPPFVHCWFGSNNSTLDRYLSFWSIPPATSKICFSKQQSGKNKIFFKTSVPFGNSKVVQACFHLASRRSGRESRKLPSESYLGEKWGIRCYCLFSTCPPSHEEESHPPS